MGLPGMSGTEVVRALRSRIATATLPVLLMTGSGDEDSVIEGLDAGADDFLPKPVRLDELVARVNAHLRKQAAWSDVVEDELRARAGVVAALGHLPVSSVPEEAAETVVRELAKRTDSDSIAVLQLGTGDQLQELATFSRSGGVRRGGRVLAPALARSVLARAREGPWVEETELDGSEAVPPALASVAAELAAGAPIYAGDELVGILTIGISRGAGRFPVVRRARLLAAAIDYASVLSTVAGAVVRRPARRRGDAARLRRVLTARQFHPVFQPIVELRSGAVVGFEALTRFDDGTLPDIRFAEATRGGLGTRLRAGDDPRRARRRPCACRSTRSSRSTCRRRSCVHGDRRFRELVRTSTRPLVLELTEHVPIDDYARVRSALVKLGITGLAVDDAGAGYASLRHILELRPTYAKLDISLVRGIDGDDLRQALAAGLQYFAFKTGCRLIAEGVESRAEADTLHRLGVTLGQGDLLGRPERAA